MLRRFVVAALLTPALLGGQSATRYSADIDRRVAAVMPKVIAWRRDIHAHPELSTQEMRTGKLVADHLRALGLDVRYPVGKTGVVGVLKGGKPGPVVALRADMDALPVAEEVDVPFRSTATATYNGQTVGVMHACGHDTHTAMLMGAAEVLAGMKAELPGTVVFMFQPAEEGAPTGYGTAGAAALIADGAMDQPKADAVFGLHVFSSYPTGVLATRPAGIMASSDNFTVTVHGKQTHGAMPWAGVDPIVVASQIVLGLQTIASRQIEFTKAPAIITVGMIHGGVRSNIIPDSVVLQGTIRTFDVGMQKDIHERVRRTAESIAQSAGATATVDIDVGYPVTFNDPALTARMAPTLQRVAGPGKSVTADVTTTSEDFSLYEKRAPGIFVFLGVTPPDQVGRAAANHSPRFYVDEAALPVGVRALTNLAVDYLSGGK